MQGTCLDVQSPGFSPQKSAIMCLACGSSEVEGWGGRTQCTGHLLPARHRWGPPHARAEGTKGSQPFTVLESTQSFPSASPKLLGNVKAPVLQELGSKETRVWAMGGKQPHDTLPQQPWAGTFDACRLGGLDLLQSSGGLSNSLSNAPFLYLFSDNSKKTKGNLQSPAEPRAEIL